MCNYTLAFLPPASLGKWGKNFDSFRSLISYLLVDFSYEDEDDNRGSGR